MNQQLVYSFLMMVVTKNMKTRRTRDQNPPHPPPHSALGLPARLLLTVRQTFGQQLGHSLSLLQHLSQLEAIILQETPFHSCRVLSLHYLCIFAQYLGIILWYAPRLC